MNSLLDVMKKRTSVRKYNKNNISKEELEKILEAGLLAPSSRNFKSSEFICVKDQELLYKLSECKNAGASMLKDADAAVIVIDDKEKCDVWIEDCSIAMAHMHLMATELNIGSCWIQCRLRNNNVDSAEDYIRRLFDIPIQYGVLAILSLGRCDENLWREHTLKDNDIKRVHSVNEDGNVLW